MHPLESLAERLHSTMEEMGYRRLNTHPEDLPDSPQETWGFMYGNGRFTLRIILPGGQPQAIVSMTCSEPCYDFGAGVASIPITRADISDPVKAEEIREKILSYLADEAGILAHFQKLEKIVNSSGDADGAT